MQALSENNNTNKRCLINAMAFFFRGNFIPDNFGYQRQSSHDQPMQIERLNQEEEKEEEEVVY